MNKDTDTIIRPTMEAVFSNQERLRKHLDSLISENRTIKDNDERDEFIRELTYSTLGLGVLTDFFIDLSQYDGGVYPVHNVESVARWLTYQKNNIVQGLRAGNGITDPAPISVYWESLRNSLFQVFPLAVERACSISKEQSDTKKSGGFQIEQ